MPESTSSSAATAATAEAAEDELREWSSAKELAAWLGIPLTTLYWMNTQGNAPVRHHIGGKLRYRRRNIEAWLKSREVAEAP